MTEEKTRAVEKQKYSQFRRKKWGQTWGPQQTELISIRKGGGVTKTGGGEGMETNKTEVRGD